MEIKTEPNYTLEKATRIHLETTIGPQEFLLFDGDHWLDLPENDYIEIYKNGESMRFYRRHLVGLSDKVIEVKRRVQGPPTEQASQAPNAPSARKSGLTEAEIAEIDRGGLRVR